LNSSLAQSAAELWLTKVWPEIANAIFCVTYLFLSKIGFLSHNFSSRYARKSNKGSKDTDFGIVSKKGSLDCPTGPDEVGQKFQNTSTYDVPHREPKTENFFSAETRRLP